MMPEACVLLQRLTQLVLSNTEMGNTRFRKRGLPPRCCQVLPFAFDVKLGKVGRQGCEQTSAVWSPMRIEGPGRRRGLRLTDCYGRIVGGLGSRIETRATTRASLNMFHQIGS